MKTKKPTKKKAPAKPVMKTAKKKAAKTAKPKPKPKKAQTTKKVVKTVEVSLPVTPPEYHGMRWVPEERKEAVDGLIALLREIEKLEPNVKVDIYGEYAKVTVRGHEAEMWLIDEISFSVEREGGGIGGSSLMASEPSCLGLLRAAEGYLGHFFTEPYRPEGWESDLDEKKDAEWRLRQVWTQPKCEPNQLPINVEEAKCAFDWMTADNDETDESVDPFGHYTEDERIFLRRLQEFIKRHNDPE